ncbi:MAG: dihydrolipoyllysine-residue acetyltransferase [Pseudomonadota bacterium]
MSQMIEVKVPDIGDFKDVPVIEVIVKPGDTVAAEDPIVTLESYKATLDIPAPAAGVVQSVAVRVGDRVSEGSLILTLEAAGAPAQAATTATPNPPQPPFSKGGSGAEKEVPPFETGGTGGISFPASPPPVPGPSEPVTAPAPVAMPGPADLAAELVGGHKAHASPSVRRYARELGVDVAKVKGSGPKGRILKEDVNAYVKGALTQLAAGAAAAAGGGTLDLLPWPKVDFAKFGPVEAKPLARIKKISGANLARNWVMIPHVTQFDEADITDLEALRVQLNKENEKSGVKLTLLAFLIKAAVSALKKFPDFNSSLDGDNLIYKQYYHIGFAADTPNGLMVPVIKDADKKGVLDIARETAELAKLAREGKLKPTDMQGGCFSISSLGGLGGTAFTPIVNAPEVAILGVSKSIMKPVWDGKQFVPRLMLPLSLSYDHRVIDGAAGARFTTYLGQLLADMRRVLL